MSELAVIDFALQGGGTVYTFNDGSVATVVPKFENNVVMITGTALFIGDL